MVILYAVLMLMMCVGVVDCGVDDYGDDHVDNAVYMCLVMMVM